MTISNENYAHNDFITDTITQSIAVKEKLLTDKNLLKNINLVATQCLKTFKNGGKILLAGNGGSAADAQHIAAELVCRLNFERPGLAAMALATNYSVITAAGNDYSFDNVFAREIEANGQPGDVFIAISTSGNSKNIVKAIKVAQKKGIYSVGLCGETGQLIELSDCCLSIPSSYTPRIQECHILIGHILCEIIENSLFSHLR